MKNGLLGSITVLSIGLAAAGGAAAQKQTAEGAQKFLASVAANQGGTRAAVVGVVPVVETLVFRLRDTTSRKSGDIKRLIVGDVAAIVAGPSACASVATSIPIDVGILNNMGAPTVRGDGMEVDWLYEARQSPTVLVANIDWGKAIIKRGAYVLSEKKLVDVDPAAQGVFVGASGMALQYRSEDAQMLDRIEYAMNFLKASCDSTAATGF